MFTIDEAIANLIRLVSNLQVQRQVPPYVLNLPNLRVNWITPLPVPTGVEIRTSIANVGTRDSGPFWVMTTIARNGGGQTCRFSKFSRSKDSL